VSILCTFPGRHGDMLWAMPTARAISEALGAPVDLQIAGEFGTLAPVLRSAPYLGQIFSDARWALTPPEEWRPPVLVGIDKQDAPSVGNYDRIVHLGYRGWPSCPLPQFVYTTTQQEYPDLPMAPLDLQRPWLSAEPFEAARWVEGWTECHFELKVGLSELLWQHFMPLDKGVPVNISTGGRWRQERALSGCSWVTAARWIVSAPVFLGDCSALHVLAVAMGIPVILMEPMEARWNDIFYPLGKTDRVRLVTGNDGLPTFDARHVADALTEALHAHSA
jgi:hypothetical protein